VEGSKARKEQGKSARAFLRWMKAAAGKKVLNQHEALLSLQVDLARLSEHPDND
jgi:hypothetical protein